MRVLNIYEEFVRKLLLKKSNVSLVDYMIYFSKRKEELGRSNSRSKTIKSTIKHIVNFSPESIPLNKVDKEFCIGFIKYLKEYNKNNKHLSISDSISLNVPPISLSNVPSVSLLNVPGVSE